MINTSEKYKETIETERRFIPKISCLLRDGTTLEFNRSNLMSGGVKIADSITGSNKFDIGSAIINQSTLTVCNINDLFSEYDFSDAVLTIFVGLEFTDGKVEWIKKGVYNASDPTTTPDVITLKANDNMKKFDAAFDGNLGFPETLQGIVQYCCSKCGVTLANGQFPNYNYRVSKNPFNGSSNITYRTIISHCALLAGCYARCNIDGKLEFKWYDTSAFEGIYDGGIFDKTEDAKFQTGDNLEGGNFTDYNLGDSIDGGTFVGNLPYHHIYKLSSVSVSTEDIVITGIRVTAADGEDTYGNKIEGETYLCGAEGYVLEVSRNPLIEPGRAKAVAEYLAGRVVGIRFRPFQASPIGDPSWEAGDAAVITDRKGNSYNTYLTSITYSVGGYANISCEAEPAARHSAAHYSQIEQIVADIKRDSQRQLSTYAKYVEDMNQLSINALGYYETSEKQSDGSTIHYMHDKPLLSQSMVVYKQSIDGFFWSQDGGKTWTGGIDKNGNAVMNVIAAIGISFDWAHGGTLTLGGKDNTNGTLKMLNANGTENGRWNKDGIDILKGNINLGNGAFIASDKGEVKSVGAQGGVKRTIDSSKGTLDFFKDNDRIGRITPFPIVIFEDNENYLSISGRDGINFCHEYESGGTIYGTTPCMTMKFDANGIAKTIFYQNVDFKAAPHFDNIAYMSQIKWKDNTTNGIASNGGYGTQVFGGFHASGNITCDGYMSCKGAKPRIVSTDNYSERFLYCYEMPSPMFGDIGEGITDETGECYVSIDDVFSEAVDSMMEYQVFLQKEGDGDIWVDEKKPTHFKVKGTSSLKFAWEIKAKQRGYEYDRMEAFELLGTQQADYETEYLEEIKELIAEKEMPLYEATEQLYDTEH